MNIRELMAKTGIAARQVRYLIAEGFMPSPAGGRSNAEYGDEHVSAIKRYTRLRELGFPPAAIKLLNDTKRGAPIPVAPGVTLVIDPELVASGTPTRPILTRIEKKLSEYLKEGSYGQRRSKSHQH